ncbi:Glycoside hydrolase family 43 [Penicillium taxi]|uniref:Glycoside hydrolase family 43 n=1 Tax=Penicillium taxi TaxID=168475 RepID=UPI00254529AE|nr:Glycoside hydrolase family 43 [Penicillium taxi]KAJ5908781.1 Glycoside hydrolase family 43 [Penicillium taxi]
MRDISEEKGELVNYFPPPRQSQQHTHDPNIIHVGDTFYLYTVGEHIFIHTAPALAGPWRHVGSVLDANSIIPKGDRAVPWAPTVVEVDGTYYCYYSVSKAGCRDSAIGVATSSSPGPGNWYDHGAVIQTGTGIGSEIAPYTFSNAIDPSVLVLPNGQGYLTFGSYWTGIYQVPLSKDLLSPLSTTSPDAHHLAYEPVKLSPPNKRATALCGDKTGAHAIEGAFISHNGEYYYLWFSHGRCCDLDRGKLPEAGNEYSIRVGRSKNPRGPFFDKSGKDLVKGGGTTVYGSNGETYAPGGQGVLRSGDTDILYYHYQNRTVSYAFADAVLGFNPLKYVNGWPVAQA